MDGRTHRHPAPDERPVSLGRGDREGARGRMITNGTSRPTTKGQDTINSPEIPESSLQPLRGDAMEKTVSFDARHGWRYVNQSGDWCGCPPPFVTHKQAVDYALQRLKATEDSPYAVIVDARAALEWAANL